MGRDLLLVIFRNSAGWGGYRSQYTYFSNLVARRRLPCTTPAPAQLSPNTAVNDCMAQWYKVNIEKNKASHHWESNPGSVA